jgi:DNA topoisomerase IB
MFLATALKNFRVGITQFMEFIYHAACVQTAAQSSYGVYITRSYYVDARTFSRKSSLKRQDKGKERKRKGRRLTNHRRLSCAVPFL